MDDPRIVAIANRQIAQCLDDIEPLEPKLKALSKTRIKQAIRWAADDVAKELSGNIKEEGRSNG